MAFWKHSSEWDGELNKLPSKSLNLSSLTPESPIFKFLSKEQQRMVKKEFLKKEREESFRQAGQLRECKDMFEEPEA